MARACSRPSRGLRAARVSFNAESVDVTSLESQGGWRELLSGAGREIRRDLGLGRVQGRWAQMNGRVSCFLTGKRPNFQVIIPDFGIVEGAFQVTGIEYAGSHNGEATYEMSLASAGALSFTAL